MRSIHAILLSFAAQIASAQIVIGPADMPSEGDTLRFSTAQQPDADVATTGAGITWDFSTLVPLAEGENVAVSVGITPFLYQFYFNNPILYPEHDASFAMEGPEFDLQVLTIEETFEYFKKDASGYRNVGFGGMLNGLPTSVRRQPVDWIYRFPMEFGNVDSSFSTWEVEIPGTFYFEQEQWRHNEVDGWGTLMLPADTFEVLRVRSVLNRHDSTYVEQFGTGFAFDEPETVEYKWLATGMGRPVLSIITVGGVPSVIEFHYDPDGITTGIAGLDRNSTGLFPNPATENITVIVPEGSSGRIHVRDINGRIVFSAIATPGSQIEMQIDQLANGTYTIGSQGGDRPWRQRFVVAH